MLNWDTYKSGLGRIDVMLLKIGNHNPLLSRSWNPNKSHVPKKQWPMTKERVSLNVLNNKFQIFFEWIYWSGFLIFSCSFFNALQSTKWLCYLVFVLPVGSREGKTIPIYLFWCWKRTPKKKFSDLTHSMGADSSTVKTQW